MNIKYTIGLILTAVTVFLLTMILNGCCCNRDDLFDYRWVLEKYGPKDSPTEVLPPAEIVPPARSEITLQLKEDGRFNGNDGCNSIFGQYELNSWCRIDFGGISTTMMNCRENVMSQAGAIREILNNTKRYSVSATHLKLYSHNESILIYKKGEE